MEIIEGLHSGWRFVVILATLLLFGYFVYALVTKPTPEKRESTFLKAWAGIIDTQILIGIILAIAHIIDGSFEGQFMGHIIIMLVVMVVGHGLTIYTRVQGTPNPQTLRLLGVGLPITAMVLIIVGLLALGEG